MKPLANPMSSQLTHDNFLWRKWKMKKIFKGIKYSYGGTLTACCKFWLKFVTK